MTATIIRANARSLPLTTDSVDLIVTSPPYFALRSYQDGGTHYAGQIGDEPTPAAFVDSLLEVTAECMRVLKPSGSLWINLGDKYAQTAAQWGGSRRGHQGILAGTAADEATRFGVAAAAGSPRMGTVRPKSLIGIPWRYAIRCIDELGLILRAEVIWSKPNGLPESVTDRVRRSHEQWFHFTKSPKYYSAVDEIREEVGRPPRPIEKVRASGSGVIPGAQHRWNGTNDASTGANPLGKLPGSVWTIATQPLKVPADLGVDHFAAFPMEWPRRLIKGWSPEGVCVECGEGRRPVSNANRATVDYGRSEVRATERVNATQGTITGGTKRSTLGHTVARTITGYVCACTPYTDHKDSRGSWAKGRGRDDGKRNHPERDEFGNRPLGPKPSSREYHFDEWEPPPTTPGVVLDPFGGTGTTALVASALGRRGISVDMSADYCRLAQWRTTDPKQIDKATNPTKPKRTTRPTMPKPKDDLERIRQRHPDIPQDPLPLEIPAAVPVRKNVNESKPRPARSVRFASCPKCLADKEIGVIRRPDGVEVFRDHNKTIGKGRRIPCPGSGLKAPEVAA